MKHTYQLFTLILLAFSLSSCLPTFRIFERDGKLLGVLPLKNGRVVYQETVRLEQLSKEEIFRRARRWWVNNYRSAKDVFQLVDKETGEIVGKGYGTVYKGYLKSKVLAPHDIYHVISVDVKPGEYTMTVYGLAINDVFVQQYYNRADMPLPLEYFNIGTVKYAQGLYKEIDKQTLLTMESLRNYITTPTIP